VAWVTPHKIAKRGGAGRMDGKFNVVDGDRMGKTTIRESDDSLSRSLITNSKKRIVRSIAERHSPPVRKNVLTKTYKTPQTIIPVEIRGQGR